jgi:hypothetical protein
LKFAHSDVESTKTSEDVMAEINVDQRQKAKAAAANAAVAANDMAVVLGAAGAVVAFAGVASGAGALAGVGAGAVLAVGSFGAWWIGNRYQRLANDPPRDDFDQFFTSEASIEDSAVSTEEPTATVIRFAAQNFVLADALAALVTALEKHDAALNSGDESAASAQADSVVANSQKVVAATEALSGSASAVNEAWTATIPTIAWENVAIGQAQDLLSSSVGDPTAPGEAQTQVLAVVRGLTDAPVDISGHPVLFAREMPPQPTVLVNDAFLSAMTDVSNALSSLGPLDNV